VLLQVEIAFVSGDDFVLRECVQDVLEVIQLVREARSADLSNFFDLSAKWLGPFFNVAVVMVEDEVRCESQL
jgi:hypothetical protein